MSAAALQRVVVRMLHDPALVAAVYADADTGQPDEQHNASNQDTEAVSVPAGTMSRRPE